MCAASRLTARNHWNDITNHKDTGPHRSNLAEVVCCGWQVKNSIHLCKHQQNVFNSLFNISKSHAGLNTICLAKRLFHVPSAVVILLGHDVEWCSGGHRAHQWLWCGCNGLLVCCRMYDSFWMKVAERYICIKVLVLAALMQQTAESTPGIIDRDKSQARSKFNMENGWWRKLDIREDRGC